MGIIIKMKTAFAMASVATLTQAAVSDFPKFDSLHAHCAMSTNYENTLCSALYTEMDHELRSWSTGGPAQGVYTIYEQEEGVYIWSTRLTKNKQYTDDQIFEFSQEGQACHVAARSRSQSHSYYDYDVNYCNMWNVLNELGGMGDIQTSDCQFKPKDKKAAETCAVY